MTEMKQKTSIRGQRSGADIRKRRNALYVYQSAYCFWCGEHTNNKDATLDEIIPRSHGGRQNWGNIVMACRACNEARADTCPTEVVIEQVKLRGNPNG
jgi:5-methylcytosine-specific restriction endonuclease McrA